MRFCLICLNWLQSYFIIQLIRKTVVFIVYILYYLITLAENQTKRREPDQAHLVSAAARSVRGRGRLSESPLPTHLSRVTSAESPLPSHLCRDTSAETPQPSHLSRDTLHRIHDTMTHSERSLKNQQRNKCNVDKCRAEGFDFY